MKPDYKSLGRYVALCEQAEKLAQDRRAIMEQIAELAPLVNRPAIPGGSNIERRMFSHWQARHGIKLNEHQQSILDVYHAAPVAGGKSTLVAMLYMFDNAAPHYVEWFSKTGFSGRQMS